jgi:RNA polymerase sigma factor for flagellar operon FliA
MSLPESVEPDLWHRYRNQDDDQARDQLFLHYAPWATLIAKSVHQRVRAYRVDRDDFVQNATIGLLEAMSRFDPSRGIAFRSYAKTRVRGAVFNGLRAILGERLAPSEEVRFVERLQNLQADESEGSAFTNVVDSIVGLGIGYLLDEAADTGNDAPNDGLTYVQNRELEAHLMIAVSKLPDRLKMIVQSHYFQYVPFQELASRLGLTKGRISQLHKSALDKLREILRNL